MKDEILLQRQHQGDAVVLVQVRAGCCYVGGLVETPVVELMPC